MRYHLKEDGTAGPCKAAPGNCPKGAAIHGDSIQEVYTQLETVMKAQLFPDTEYPAPEPRKSPREIGSAGMMMQYSNPEIIKLQLEAFAKLGIISDAIPVLEKHSPVIGKAWEIGTQANIDYALFYEKPQPYSNWVADHKRGDGYVSEYHTGENPTWVAHTHYELQTAALNSLMAKLEDGDLDGVDLDAYQVALGDTGVIDSRGKGQSNAFLAFNYNPHRQDFDFYNNVKARFVKEGFGKTELSANKSKFTVPKFFWNGLDDKRKERVASYLLTKNYDSKTGKRSYEEKALGREFGEMMSSTFAHTEGLTRAWKKADTPVSFVLDYDGSKAEGVFKFTDEGFEWTENSRVYVTPKPDPRLDYRY